MNSLSQFLKSHLIHIPLNQLRSHFYSKMSSANPTRISAYESFAKGGDDESRADLVVDLRSDTVTKPNAEMRKAMANAIVGDDVFREDPTVNELENRMAKIMGKEAGLFVTSGTMGNFLSAMTHCDVRGSEMIVGSQSHMFCYEQGNVSQFGGIHSNQILNNPDGTFNITDLVDHIRVEDLHYPTTKLICVENTHNRCGGRVVPLQWLDELAEVSKEYNVPLHLDGARIFNASTALGVPPSKTVKEFSSVSICFSKGLGAPVGSVIVGSVEFIEKARRLRKGVGGAMRQVGILAAAGLYCLDNMIDRLQDDHNNAKTIAKIINSMNSPNVFINYENLDTNIIMLNVKGFSVSEFCQRLGKIEDQEKNALGALVCIKCSPWSETAVRLVTHADVSAEMAIKAAEKICYVTKAFAAAS